MSDTREILTWLAELPDRIVQDRELSLRVWREMHAKAAEARELLLTPQEKFQRHLEAASKEVASWPAWKQGLLEASMRPTNEHPRTPIVNDE